MLQEKQSIIFRYRTRKQFVFKVGATEIMENDSSDFKLTQYADDVWNPTSALVVKVANDLEELKW